MAVLGIGSSPFRHHTSQSAAHLLEKAMDLGINYYDTARSYLQGEEAVASLPACLRNSLIVATKTGARGGKYCLDDLQQSLRTTKRNWIDVWMTHMIQTDEDYEQCVDLGGFCDIAVAARQAGLVRATGASFHASTALIERAITEHAFDIVMFPFNIIGRETVFGSSIASYRDRLLPAAQANGVGVVVMKALAGGELRYGAPGLSFLSDTAFVDNTVLGAIRYPTMSPQIATTVVGMSTVTELTVNALSVADVDDTLGLMFDRWSRLADAMRGPCSRCGDCIPVCPERIEIPKVMRLHDQFRCFLMKESASWKYSQMEINASACTGCRACQRACPLQVDIVAELQLSHEVLVGKSAGDIPTEPSQKEEVCYERLQEIQSEPASGQGTGSPTRHASK